MRETSARARLSNCRSAIAVVSDATFEASDVYGESLSDPDACDGKHGITIRLVSGREQCRVDPLRNSATKAAGRLARAKPFWI